MSFRALTVKNRLFSFEPILFGVLCKSRPQNARTTRKPPVEETIKQRRQKTNKSQDKWPFPI